MSAALESLIAAALARDPHGGPGADRRALSRLLSRVEAGGDTAAAVVERVYAGSAGAHRIGVTGAPGTGKSTLVSKLALELRRRRRHVAVVAVDPTSPFTGGALLGDRVRMAELSDDAGIFVRSMASRGATGGLAAQTAATATVLAAAGFAAILIETVGVGQDELAIAQEAQTTVVLTAPGLGDDVQALKAGLLEIADVLVVNKADREGADRLAAELRFGRGRRDETAAWTVPLVKTVATTGDGVPALADAIERHRAWLEESGAGVERARRLAERQILRWAAARALQQAQLRAERSGDWQHLVDAVAAHHLAPPAAAEALLRPSPAARKPSA